MAERRKLASDDATVASGSSSDEATRLSVPPPAVPPGAAAPQDAAPAPASDAATVVDSGPPDRPMPGGPAEQAATLLDMAPQAAATGATAIGEMATAATAADSATVRQPSQTAATSDTTPATPVVGQGSAEDATVSDAGLRYIGKYRIDKILGEGAMGVVYKGYDPVIARPVAIKTVRESGLSDAVLQQFLARFRREAQAAGRLNHPNVVAVYDYGEASGTAYIVMEFIEGRTLRDALDAGERFDVEAAFRMVRGVLDALDHAHAAGVIHRDIKPANIMLTGRGQVKLTDFGIARLEDISMTQTGAVMGTPAYMSPEQVQGSTLDHRSDIYTTGVVLYELLTGDKPFTGRTAAVVMQKIVSLAPVKPSQLNVAVPTWVDAIVEKATAKAPTDRYQSAADFATALAPLAAASKPPGSTGSGKGLLWATVGGGVIAAAVAGWFLVGPGSTPTGPTGPQGPVVATPGVGTPPGTPAGPGSTTPPGGGASGTGAPGTGPSPTPPSGTPPTGEAPSGGTGTGAPSGGTQGSGGAQGSGGVGEPAPPQPQPPQPQPPNRLPVATAAHAVETVVGVGPVPLGVPAPSDPDGDRLSIRVESAPNGGTLRVGSRVLGDGDSFAAEDLDQLTFEPASGSQDGTARLRYSVLDGRGGTANGAVTLSIKVDDCDRLAAFPQDPAGVGPGVASTAITSDAAIAACAAAVARFPGVTRFEAQLGRAFHAAQNFPEAMRHYQAAADGGSVAAQANLGVIYLTGQGVAADAASGVRWLRRAAEQGYAPAQNNLGYLYGVGQGVPQDYGQAAHWYRLAADQGYADAQNSLGTLYRNGQGVTRDPSEAVRYFRLAATQGQPWGQNNLGVMYLNGEGVPQDEVEAVRWFGRVIAGSASPQAPAAQAARQNLELLPAQVRVRAAQRLLNDAGFDAGPDNGAIRQQTRAAIRSFQSTHGLQADGEVTLDLLIALAAAAPSG